MVIDVLEMVLEWEGPQALLQAMPEPRTGRLTVFPAESTHTFRQPTAGEVVTVVFRLLDRGLEFRALAKVRGGSAQAGWDLELFSEEAHIAETLQAYVQGEGIPYAHRYGKRVRLRLPVQYQTDGGPLVRTHTRDVGEGGLWISSEDPVPVGTVLGIALEPPQGVTAGRVSLQGKVVAATNARPQPGMAVEFLFADREAARAYQRWFRQVLDSLDRP